MSARKKLNKNLFWSSKKENISNISSSENIREMEKKLKRKLPNRDFIGRKKVFWTFESNETLEFLELVGQILTKFSN